MKRCLDTADDSEYGSISTAIRHRRKFAGQMLLSPTNTLRNLSIIRNQMAPLLDTLVYKACEGKEIGEDDHDTKLQCAKQYVDREAREDTFWSKTIKEVNATQSQWQTSKVDVKRSSLPFAKAFVSQFFSTTDREKYDTHASSEQFSGVDHYYFRIFVESWRSVPEFYTYDHDVLLLRLYLTSDS